MNDKTILVTGATGQQGGAVAAALMAGGHAVRAMVRDPEAPKARALADAGATLVTADLDRPETLPAALAGVDSVFLVTTMWTGLDAEVRHGKAMVDAAAAAGVGHLVYSSVASADRETGVPHFESKFEVEQHLAASGLNWTVSAPVFFYENLLFPFNTESIAGGVFGQPLPAGRGLQMIALADIGAFNAHVLVTGAPFFGRRVDIAGDELTGPEVAAVLSEVTGSTVDYIETPLADMLAQSEDMGLMYKWFDEVGYSADLADLRESHAAVRWQSFADWTRTHSGAFGGAA